MTLKQLRKAVYAVAVLAAASPALADDVDMRVTGAISPGGCTPKLTGSIDYGDIDPSDLSRVGYTVLDEKQLDLNITCDAPMRVAIKVINLRPGTFAAGPETGEQGVGSAPVILFGHWGYIGAVGLGLHGEAKVGGYSIRFEKDSFYADGQPMSQIISYNKGNAWVKPIGSGSLYSEEGTVYGAWAAADTQEVALIKVLNGKLGVHAFINKASELDLTKPIVLDGMTTFELVYL